MGLPFGLEDLPIKKDVMVEIGNALEIIYDKLEQFRLIGDLNSFDIDKLRNAMIKFIDLTKDI